MTATPNIEDLLARLTDNSRGELNLIRTLNDAIRRADEQLLREVRGVTLQHELRRETILGELQTLATRLCALPSRAATSPARPVIESYEISPKPAPADTQHTIGTGADWRQAAQNIHDELEFTFNVPPPRH